MRSSFAPCASPSCCDHDCWESNDVLLIRDFAPRFRPTSTRFVKSYCHLFKFPWLKCANLLASLELPLSMPSLTLRLRYGLYFRCRSSPDAVSWTDKSVEYFIYQVDRNNLARQKAFKGSWSLPGSEGFCLRCVVTPVLPHYAEAAKKGLRLSDNLVCSLKDGEIVVEAAVPPPAAKGKGNESEENSDVEIGALMQAEFRGDSAKHLLHVLRGGHALTQMLKSLGCDTAKYDLAPTLLVLFPVLCSCAHLIIVVSSLQVGGEQPASRRKTEGGRTERRFGQGRWCSTEKSRKKRPTLKVLRGQFGVVFDFTGGGARRYRRQL